MIKTTFLINEEIYKAIFADEREAIQFAKENEADGSEVFFVKQENTSVVELWYDKDFDHDYKVEMIAYTILPNKALPNKVDLIEEVLMNMGVIPR